MKKTTLIATALVTALSVSTASSAFAWWGEGEGGKEHNKGCGSEYRSSHGQKSDHGKRGMMGKHANFKEHMSREFTADEVKILNEAHLIKQGNPNVKVGTVTSTKDGYKVTIVTKDNSLVKEIELAKNGMSLDRYNMMQERMEAKQKN
ncbi:hypothetical protein [Endozoicomonas sp.]|uniref:hypothetical protein n=1 Tax=Endozoicomonas sp. TaxID=1892382 RepID=UPI00288567F8|nr:hypothetical protein [Endozoicomonas sp.]